MASVGAPPRVGVGVQVKRHGAGRCLDPGELAVRAGVELGGGPLGPGGVKPGGDRRAGTAVGGECRSTPETTVRFPEWAVGVSDRGDLRRAEAGVSGAQPTARLIRRICGLEPNASSTLSSGSIVHARAARRLGRDLARRGDSLADVFARAGYGPTGSTDRSWSGGAATPRPGVLNGDGEASAPGGGPVAIQADAELAC